MTTYYHELSRCPKCQGSFVNLIAGSCNTIRAKIYTDGHIRGPMYDPGHELLKCPSCAEILWVSDLVIEGDDSPFQRDLQKDGRPNEAHRAKMAAYLSPEDYFEVVRRRLWRTRSQEKCARISAWWAFNDQFRDTESSNWTLTHEQEGSLIRLHKLLILKNDAEKIMRAEVCRELGQFEACLVELGKTRDLGGGHSTHAKRVIANLALRGVRRVMAIAQEVKT